MLSGVGDYHQNSCRPCGLRVVCSSKVHCALCVQYHGTIVSIYTISYQTDFSPSTLDDYRPHRKLWQTLQDDMTQKRNDTRLVRTRCSGGWRLFLCLTRAGWPAARRAHLARSHPQALSTRRTRRALGVPACRLCVQSPSWSLSARRRACRRLPPFPRPIHRVGPPLASPLSPLSPPLSHAALAR